MTTQHLSPLTMLLSRHTRRREFISLLGGAPAVWLLEGRAIQDGVDPAGLLLRHDAAGLRSRHRRLAHPLERSLKQRYRRQIGRAHGDDIMQEGNDDTGAAVRWSFTEITPTSFRWRGERSPDGGANWELQAEYFARRVNS